ncbi:IS4 family transposase [Streptomyces sp. NPDC057426]|uniref:IS4 family transposase n=1 Tax=Streptomyces sp. NPDC057426 TaxID=3346128 RepID=UPI00368E5EDF
MPRPGQSRTTPEERLPERMALGLLFRTFPPELVDRVVAECGRAERRSRLLPARTVVYFVLAICLFEQRSYEQVAQLLTEGLAWARQERTLCTVPTTAAISRARARLGPEPLAALFTELARQSRPAGARTRCARFRQWAVLAIDGTTVDVPDTPENRARYGPSPSRPVPAPTGDSASDTAPRPGPASRSASASGSGFPQVHVVALAECGSHRITGAVLGRLPSGGPPAPLARALFTTLTHGDLLLADCGPADLELLHVARAAGAEVLWRIGLGTGLPVHVGLPDGSYLSDAPCGATGARTAVRVIEEPPYRLVTSLLDPEAAPAGLLAALYDRRWDIRTSLRDLGALSPEGPQVLRSRWPGGVEQEVWGHLLVHHTIRSLLGSA